MTQRVDFDKIEICLVRVLQPLITERSVDPLRVRAGNARAVTDVALQLPGPASLLQDADRLLSPCSRSQPFDAATHRGMFHLAASDCLDPFLLPQWVSHLKRLAPVATSDPALARAA
jgi:hypothetical protein